MTKNIVGLMQTAENIVGLMQTTGGIVGRMMTTENIVGMIEMMKGTGTALRRGQESGKTWTDTGIVLSLSIAGIREADCPRSTIAQNVVNRRRTTQA